MLEENKALSRRFIEGTREAREEAGVATTEDRDYVGFVLRTRRLMAV